MSNRMLNAPRARSPMKMVRKVRPMVENMGGSPCDCFCRSYLQLWQELGNQATFSGSETQSLTPPAYHSAKTILDGVRADWQLLRPLPMPQVRLGQA